jgi:hypothetical protein
MKRSLFLFASLIILSIVFCRCKKDEVVDSTDRFAGYYTYVLTNSYLPDTSVDNVDI